jgi:hypothetical protein
MHNSMMQEDEVIMKQGYRNTKIRRNLRRPVTFEDVERGYMPTLEEFEQLRKEKFFTYGELQTAVYAAREKMTRRSDNHIYF